ncbi:substrate-binding periplasmic protein [Bdellovibrio bacteriovorus]|uniref:Putative ABC-type amino acid transport periplasmic protein n=1 Tax=Bdellovibrio bacteriovorus str. Tiberius TaxID=1069642 RepID=K7ZGH8_BDEBC|nr:ABC transporter substrate-binding protein [Bdellovibrio bacteriovorus]AFY02497.1 putative ABC-type amino acid transport periplasmic protein [Bdellovibrio bacteriovorus str. Tiberius]
MTAIAKLALLILALAANMAHATSKKTITLITHEAPPYMSESLPDQGAVFYALRQVFKKSGFDLKVTFAPSWVRAKMNALKDKEVDGYAPFRTVENSDVFEFSDFVFESPWVIAERKEKPIVWNHMRDLSKYVAGNVQGVELRPGVKELADQGQLKIETTTSQNNNILKLATKRVDFVFTDFYVFRYLMATDPSLKPYRARLQLNAKPIVIERYGAALKKSPHSAALIKTLNENSAEFKKHIDDYLTRIEKENAH